MVVFDLVSLGIGDGVVREGWDLVNSLRPVFYGGGVGYSALWSFLASAGIGYCVGVICSGED